MIFEKSPLYNTAVSRHSPLYYKTASQASNSNISVNEIKFENIFRGLSGPQMELFYEKKRRWKISWHCPFKFSGEAENTSNFTLVWIFSIHVPTTLWRSRGNYQKDLGKFQRCQSYMHRILTLPYLCRNRLGTCWSLSWCMVATYAARIVHFNLVI